MHDMKLAKLQYLAERESLIRFLNPMISDEPVSLYHGPCLSATLRLTNDTDEDSYWDSFIGFEPYDLAAEGSNTVALLAPASVSEILSPADVDLLTELWRRFGLMDSEQIRLWCQENCREYVVVPYRQRKWITTEEILMAGGDDAQTAFRKAEEIRYHQRFDRLYAHKPAALLS